MFSLFNGLAVMIKTVLYEFTFWQQKKPKNILLMDALEIRLFVSWPIEEPNGENVISLWCCFLSQGHLPSHRVVRNIDQGFNIFELSRWTADAFALNAHSDCGATFKKTLFMDWPGKMITVQVLGQTDHVHLNPIKLVLNLKRENLRDYQVDGSPTFLS